LPSLPASVGGILAGLFFVLAAAEDIAGASGVLSQFATVLVTILMLAGVLAACAVLLLSGLMLQEIGSDISLDWRDQ
jgi:hypothetical protein